MFVIYTMAFLSISRSARILVIIHLPRRLFSPVFLILTIYLAASVNQELTWVGFYPHSSCLYVSVSISD